MKHLIHGFVSIVVVTLMLLIITTITTKMTRKKELNSSLTSSLEQAVDNVMIKKSYSINNTNELIADVLEELLHNLENDSSIEIKVSGIDPNKGIVSLKAIQTYKNPNGSESKYEADKTVIMEENDLVRRSNITYYDEFGNSKKHFIAINGDYCPYYSDISSPNHTFKCWGIKQLDGSLKEISEDEIRRIVVTENIDFFPIWN